MTPGIFDSFLALAFAAMLVMAYMTSRHIDVLDRRIKKLTTQNNEIKRHNDNLIARNAVLEMNRKK